MPLNKIAGMGTWVVTQHKSQKLWFFMTHVNASHGCHRLGPNSFLGPVTRERVKSWIWLESWLSFVCVCTSLHTLFFLSPLCCPERPHGQSWSHPSKRQQKKKLGGGRVGGSRMQGWGGGQRGRKNLNKEVCWRIDLFFEMTCDLSQND